MTKPMQGILFKKFRDLITGVITIKKDTQKRNTKMKSN